MVIDDSIKLVIPPNHIHFFRPMHKFPRLIDAYTKIFPAIKVTFFRYKGYTNSS